MTLDYADAWSRAKDEPPFSNGEEGHAFEDQWCGRCLRDAPFRNGISPTGCPLLAVAISGRTPAEWFEQPWQQIHGRPDGETAPVLGDTYHCIEFRGPGRGGDGEPRPRPEPPHMDGLFKRPPRRTRMWVQPESTPVAEPVGELEHAR